MELYILCLEIIIARICDVSLGTVRTIMTVRGKNLLATILGFLEITIWFIMVKDALTSEYDSILIVLSYATGYAAGTYIGGFLSKYIRTKLCIQIIIDEDNQNIISVLRSAGFAVTVMNVEGYSEEKNKYMLLMEIDSNRFKELESILHKEDKKIFMMVNETKYVQNGYFGGIAK
ncbi:MAG: DUF2179 domain-containing protein [Bacilli bacterium]|nr:DUF2179 domain-containing protein [Bacilli bacterium]